MIAALMLIALQSAPQDNSPQPDDIVITATRDSCKVKFADKDMTDAEFDRRAEEWKAGKPVRVISRGDADFACVRKISAKLFARGVMRILFVDPDGKPALPFDTSKEFPRYDTTTGAPGAGGGGTTGSWVELRAREHRFITRTAAQLILDGKCDEARTFALKEGDLDAAAAVVEICRK
jgi:hypothetical protein